MGKFVKLNGEKVQVWPHAQAGETFNSDPTMVITDFDDTKKYHQPIIDKMLELERKKEHWHEMKIGGSKLSNLEQWGLPEIDLVLERVKALFHYVTKKKAKINLSWGNVYHNGDYLSGHSHTDAIGSIVYMLEPGELPSKQIPFNGVFAIMDPRISNCCPIEPDRAIKEICPEMKAGTMIMFPAYVIHHVHPYISDKPRLSLAFNVDFESI